MKKSHRSLQASAHLSAPKVTRKLLSPPMKHRAVGHKKAFEKSLDSIGGPTLAYRPRFICLSSHPNPFPRRSRSYAPEKA